MNLFLATSITLVQVLAPLVLSAGSLSDRINEIIKTSAADQAFWGIQVTDIHSGRILYEQHQDKLFVPASNGKLFSTALALSYLGSEYVHTTTVATAISSELNAWPARLHSIVIWLTISP